MDVPNDTLMEHIAQRGIHDASGKTAKRMYPHKNTHNNSSHVTQSASAVRCSCNKCIKRLAHLLPPQTTCCCGRCATGRWMRTLFACWPASHICCQHARLLHTYAAQDTDHATTLLFTHRLHPTVTLVTSDESTYGRLKRRV